MYAKYVKRIFDLGFAAVVGAVCLPFMLLIALGIRLGSRGPALFRQRRVGKNCRIFYIYKFRTMRTELERDGRALTDMQRMTRFGRFLRKFSLDELPQLWNVLRGDMSMIGPRPLLPEYIPKYTDFQMRRHEVLPGLSGWAQVNGRNAISWEKKFELDVWYADHICFALDVRIFFRTIARVLRRKDVDSSASETMQPFVEAGREEIKL